MIYILTVLQEQLGDFEVNIKSIKTYLCAEKSSKLFCRYFAYLIIFDL